MKKIIAAFLLMGTIAVQAQTADEIISKNMEAIGGKEKIKQVTSIIMQGSTQVMGNEAPTTITLLNGKGYKSESDFNGQKAIQCYNEKSGWTTNPMSGGNAETMPDEAYKTGKEQMNFGGALLDYAAKGSTVELQGKDGGAFKLKLVTTDKTETTYYIDATTYFISKLVRKGNFMGQDLEITIQFADYKKTDFGITVPFTVNTDLGQFQLAATFTKVEVNKPVDPAIFNMPK